MKNSILGLSLFFFALLASCQKEVSDVFVATMEGSGNGSKSYIAGVAGNRHNCWELSDIIYINGERAVDFEFVAGEKVRFKPASRSSSYEMFTFGGQPFTWQSDGTVVFNLPIDYAGQDMPMYATTSAFGPVQFRNLFSVLHFVNVPPDTVISIYSTSVQLSGDFVYNVSTHEVTSGSSVGYVRSVKSNGEDIWMVLPALPEGSFDIGIGAFRIVSGGSHSVAVNHIANVDYDIFQSDAPVIDSKYILVYDATDLTAVGGGGNKAPYVMIMKDIDFTDKSCGNVNQAKEILGNGYTITINQPLFSEIKNRTITISNMILEGTFKNGVSSSQAVTKTYSNGGNVVASNCVSHVKATASSTSYLPFN